MKMLSSCASSRHHSTGTKMIKRSNSDDVVEGGDYLCNNMSSRSCSCSEDYSDSSVLLPPPPPLHRQRGGWFNVDDNDDDDNGVGYEAVNRATYDRKTSCAVNIVHILSCRCGNDRRRQQPSPRAAFDHPSTSFSGRAFITAGSSEKESRSEPLLPSVADKMMGACESSWEMLNDLLRCRR